jgi:hypothetical protein
MESETKILGQSNTINEFCWEFIRKYPELGPGKYCSPDGLLIIEKTTIPGNTPSRVGNYSKIVQVKSDLSLNISAMLFLVIWCFIKGQDTEQLDIEVDRKVFDICRTNLEWSMADFSREIVPILRGANVSSNADRINLIESILTQQNG